MGLTLYQPAGVNHRWWNTQHWSAEEVNGGYSQQSTS